jgi:hypothetical protein
MSNDQSPPLAAELQFDRAVFEEHVSPALACRLCEVPIADTYFEVNGQPTCASCRDVLVASVGADRGMRGIFVALACGLGAGVAGALLYYAVLALSGYEIGLIAIAVGLMVGHGVKWGSGGRGGRRFQVMAVAITYVAIISTYVPFVVAGMKESAEKTAPASPAQSGPASSSPAPTHASGRAATGSPLAAPAAVAAPAAAPTPAQAPAPEAPLTFGELMIGVAIFAGLLLVLPFLGGFENIIGLLIVGFALWEAWKVNRRVILSVSGPFTTRAEAPQAASELPVLP